MRGLVLAVDDHPRNLRLLKALLEGEGWEVATASSAEEAVEFLRARTPAILLLDIQLPGMDGYELARLLRSSEATRGLPILAVTSFAMADDGARALSEGCDAWVSKPIDTRTFPDLVARLAAGRRAPPVDPA